MKPTIGIIGGGVSGLTAGIYAQQNGFDTTIYERHSIVGGLCSYWEREGFILDNCIHWLTCSTRDSDLRRIWQNTHVLRDDVKVFQNDFFLQIEENGQTLHVYRDRERLREELMRISPEDKDAIENLINLLNIYKDTVVVALKPLEQHSLLDWCRLMYRMRHIGRVHRKYQRMSLEEFVKQFKNHLIQRMFTDYFPKFYNASSMLFVYGIFCDQNADLPEGGSKGLVERMQERYLSLGGKIQCRKEVTEVVKDKRQVMSICFADGTNATADYYIAACDLNQITQHFLSERHIDKYIREHFFSKRHIYPTCSSVNVYLGADTDENILPGTVVIPLKQIMVNQKSVGVGIVKDYNYEPSFAPKGKAVLQVLITQYEDDYNYWENLRQTNRTEYKAQKQQLAEQVMQAIERAYPKYAGKLHILDVATPYTNFRFTRTYKGAYMSFMLTPRNEKLTHIGRVPHLRNFYLAGQWLQAPGGLPNAAITGKFAVQRICKDHHYPFQDYTPPTAE